MDDAPARSHLSRASGSIPDRESACGEPDTATVEAFNYPIDTRRLPLTENLRYALGALIAIFNTSIDWDYPPDSSP